MIERNTELDQALEIKKDRLFDLLKAFPNLGIGFSGGVDSTFLLAAAIQVLGDQVVAMTAQSPIHPGSEKPLAVKLAKRLGVRHIIFQTRELDLPEFVRNDLDRCYHCKIKLFTAMRRLAETEHIQFLAHGANADDSHDFRPGLRAAQELHIAAPLAEAGLNKQDIRRLARDAGLSNWDRPAMACLATRIAYGIRIESELVSRIEKAETLLGQMGISNCRVRHHGNLARIEVAPQEMAVLLQQESRQQLVDELRALGYHHIAVDLEGYVSGKMNR